MTSLEALKKARDLISDERYWTQGRMRRTSEEGQLIQYCLVGAMTEAVAPGVLANALNDNQRRAQTHLMQLVRETLFDQRLIESYDALVSWNDKPERTHAQVLEALDLTIQKNAPLS